MPQHQLDYQTPVADPRRNGAMVRGIGLLLLGLTLTAWGCVGMLFVLRGFSGKYADSAFVTLLGGGMLLIGGVVLIVAGIRLLAR